MEIIVYRMEINGQGPFWDERIFKSLGKMCRQGTPEWKKQTDGCDTFLNHYVGDGESPYECRHLASFVDHAKMENYLFGFVSKHAMIDQFGLDIPLYRKQFEYILEKNKDLTIGEYLVVPEVFTRIQAVFNPKKAELVDRYKTAEAFFKYL